MDKCSEVFKYTDILTAKKILEDGTIKFSTPKNLNDLFDISKVKIFGYDPLSEESKLAHIKELHDILFSKNELPNFNQHSEAAQILNYVHKHLRVQNNEKREKLRELLCTELDKDILSNERIEAVIGDAKNALNKSFESSSVFCGTRTYDNMALWAYYAEENKGVVFKFVPNIAKDSILRKLKEVNYSDQKPTMYKTPKDFINGGLFQDTEEVLSQFVDEHTLTKGLDWRHENEIRVHTYDYDIHHYHDDELYSIFLGYKMDSETKAKFSKLAISRNPIVKIYEMGIEDNSDYKLSAKLVR